MPTPPYGYLYSDLTYSTVLPTGYTEPYLMSDVASAALYPGWAPLMSPQLSGMVSVDGNVTIGQYLDVSGIIVASGSINTYSSLNVTGAITTWGSLNTYSSVYSVGSIYTSGSVTASGATAPNQLITYAQASGRLLNIQTITASTVYNPTPGTTSVIVTCQGAGGGGGGTYPTAATTYSCAGGGAAGARAQSRFTSGFAGQTITIGAGGTGGPPETAGGTGGTTSFGNLIVAPGGEGAGYAIAWAPVAWLVGAPASASPTGGTLVNRAGGKGGDGEIMDNGYGSGNGADSYFGAGGTRAYNTSNGYPGTGYGAGGSGASTGASSTAMTGGAGSPGIVIIEEYS